MTIKIAQRLHPFSHSPATSCLIPYSVWRVEVFPTLLQFKNHAPQNPHRDFEVKLGLKGPLKDFTVELDLESGRVKVFGHSLKGYIRLNITRQDTGIAIYFEKAPIAGVQCQLSLEKHPRTIYADEKLFIPLALEHSEVVASSERLSLGMHKAQDFDLMKRREDLRELFPIWLRLSAMIPKIECGHRYEGMFTLLKSCKDVIVKREKKEVVSCFLNLWKAGFFRMMTPRLIDVEHQGIVDEAQMSEAVSALPLLTEGADLIRSLFFQEKGEEISLLPVLPPEFDCGRFLNVTSKCKDLIDFEWSKKLLRKVVWHSGQARTIHLNLQKSIVSFRLRRSLKDKGQVLNAEDPIFLNPQETIFLDRFHK